MPATCGILFIEEAKMCICRWFVLTPIYLTNVLFSVEYIVYKWMLRTIIQDVLVIIVLIVCPMYEMKMF
jgi:hypothetical protein